jgi:hypothetical protein
MTPTLAPNRVQSKPNVSAQRIMAKHHLPPQTTLRRYKDGRGWFLEAVGDDGVAENMRDFNSEAEAWDWVVHKSAAFFNARAR